MGLVRKFFMPNSYVQSIFQIDLDKLVDKGVKGIITDLDNTLIGWDVKEPTERVKAWFKEANEKESLLQLCLIIMSLVLLVLVSI